MTALALILSGAACGMAVANWFYARALHRILLATERRVLSLQIDRDVLRSDVAAIEKRTKAPTHAEYLSTLRVALGQAPKRDHRGLAS